MLKRCATFTIDLFHDPVTDGERVFWMLESEQLACASSAGELLWSSPVDVTARCVGARDGQPLLLTHPLDPPYQGELSILDASSGKVRDRELAPALAQSVAFSGDVRAFVVGSSLTQSATQLRIGDAAVVTGKLVGDLVRLSVSGFLVVVDSVARAFDRAGRLLWSSSAAISTHGPLVLARELDGRLARLDPATGHPLWQRVVKGATRGKILHVAANDSVVLAVDVEAQRVDALDAETGDARWSKRMASNGWPLVTADLAVLTLPAKGRGAAPLAVLRLSDGERVADLPQKSSFEWQSARPTSSGFVVKDAGGAELHFFVFDAKSAAPAKRKPPASPEAKSPKRPAKR